RTHALEKATSPGADALVVRFRAGHAHPFFGRPLAVLTDQLVPLEALWPAESQRQFAATDSIGATWAALGSALERADVFDPAPGRPARRALRLIAAAPVLPRVPQLAAALGCSERQLRRSFDLAVGLTPKHYLRVIRFRRALRAARHCEKPDWAAIAEQSGYF